MIYYTTTEQSKKLVELGLNPDTADMHYIKIIRENDVIYMPELLYEDKECDIPCWSLGALLELMPAGCSLRSRKGFTADKKIYFCTCPFNNDDPINYNSSIEAAYNMVVWLIKNNYIKTDKQ